MNTTIQSQLSKLTSLIEKINNHPDLEKAIETDEDGLRWLPMCNIINGHTEAESSFIELMSELNTELCGLFISSDGQHSTLFYRAKEQGYRMRTGESDSFGPLSSVMTHSSIDWQVCYG